LTGSVTACGTTPNSAPPPSPPTTPEAPEAPPQVSPPPLNVRIDYVGVKDAGDHEDAWAPFNGELQLVVVVTDGKPAMGQDATFIPPTKQGFQQIHDFETKRIDERVFHTSSVGDYLKVSILAWDIDSKAEILNDLAILEALGAPGAAELRTLYSLLPEEDDLVGYYQHTWGADENYGIGQHEAVGKDEFGNDNFWIGFSIWSDEEPPSISEPSLLPDVKIQSVNIPSQVKDSSGCFFPYEYDNTLTIVNKESIPVEVDWNAYSSAKGEIFDSGTVTIQANGYRSIIESYYYTTLGPVTETYTLYYNGEELDSWSGTLNVIS